LVLLQSEFFVWRIHCVCPLCFQSKATDAERIGNNPIRWREVIDTVCFAWCPPGR